MIAIMIEKKKGKSMTTYTEFKKFNFDTTSLGFTQGEEESQYFCTPCHARIIGWAGVDGNHYCFVDGFGEMVFAVSPMNPHGKNVYPLARSFSDFLRLLLVCGNAAALEQVHDWNEPSFDAFLKDNPVTEEQTAVLKEIREELQLEPMPNPFSYMEQLQAEFEPEKLQFPNEYEDPVQGDQPLPEWKVTFDGNFHGHSEQQGAGKEISTLVQFFMNGMTWFIPSIYDCSEGLVVDFCVQVPAESIRAYIRKWNLTVDSNHSDFTEEQQMQIEADNPLSFHISPELNLNGHIIPASHGCGTAWNPCYPEFNDLSAQVVLDHYQLDPTYGWMIWRSAYPWPASRKTNIVHLEVTIKHDRVRIPGIRFLVLKTSDSIPFVHPITQMKHRLIIQDIQQREMPGRIGSTEFEYPTHFTLIRYTLEPNCPEGSFSIMDSRQGDRPRKKQTNHPDERSRTSCSAIGVIGGAHGPTAIFMGENEPCKVHVGCSSLHFEPVNPVEWLMLFHEKPCDDLTVKII